MSFYLDIRCHVVDLMTGCVCALASAQVFLLRGSGLSLSMDLRSTVECASGGRMKRVNYRHIIAIWYILTSGPLRLWYHRNSMTVFILLVSELFRCLCHRAQPKITTLSPNHWFSLITSSSTRLVPRMILISNRILGGSYSPLQSIRFVGMEIELIDWTLSLVFSHCPFLLYMWVYLDSGTRWATRHQLHQNGFYTFLSSVFCFVLLVDISHATLLLPQGYCTCGSDMPYLKYRPASGKCLCSSLHHFDWPSFMFALCFISN